MKRVYVTVVTLLSLTSWALPAQADSPDPLNQLLTTGACQGCNLSNADLSKTDLSNANLSQANLSNANLSQANLSQANLKGARLYLTNFKDANLTGADLSKANLTGAKLNGADLSSIQLVDANLTYAHLAGADLTGANLNGANLSDADLSQAQLANTQMTGANLNHANLKGTNLELSKNSQPPKPLKPLITATSETSDTLDVLDTPDALDAANPDKTNQELQSPQLPTRQNNQNNLVIAEQVDSLPAENPLGVDPQPPVNTSPELEDSSEPQGNPELENNAELENITEPEKTEFTAQESPIANRQFQFPTADHLRQGELVLDGRQRFFFTSNSTSAEGTPFYISAGARFGVTDNLELALAIQAADSGSFDPLDFESSIVSPNNYDVALELKQRIWQNSSKTQALSGVVSASGLRRKFVFSRNGTTSEVDGDGIVPALQLPFTIAVGNRLDLTVAPTVAFFQEDSAVFVPRTPIANPGSFGTTVGLTGAVSYQLGSRFLLWGNAFVPFVGNNSVNRSTGLPTKTVAFNSGIRYLVNPRLGLDVFATNTLGTIGPLALTTDHEEIGLGIGLVAMPDFAPGNRSYPNNFKGQNNQPDTSFTTDGLGFFDGGTVPDGKFLVHLQGGNQGVLTALRFGLIKDLEILAYLDYVTGTVDESEQGFGVKLRLLNQAEGLPFTASAAVTFGLTNQPFVNFFNNNRNEFNSQGLDKEVPFLLAGEEGEVGKLFVATLSFPVQYQLNDKVAFWFTPIAGFAQRKGLEIGGFSLGGSVEVIQDFSVLAEVGANFLGEGNGFIGNSLSDRIPWAFAVRWDASRLFGASPDTISGFHPNLELFITNRVGSSPWHQLRVRDQDGIAVGAGLSVSF